MLPGGDINTTTNDIDLGETALEGLYFVDDPEVGLNVVDLGLIYHLSFDELRKKLKVTLTFTTQFCPMGDTIKTDVMGALKATFPDWQITLDLTFDPPWDAAMISHKGKEFLGQY